MFMFDKRPLLSNICDLICEKGLLLKHLKTVLYTYSCYMCTFLFMVTVYIQNCFLRCFSSGSFSQISSQTFWLKWSLIANQVTYSKIRFLSSFSIYHSTIDKVSMDIVKATWLLLILLLKCTGMIILITNVLFYLVLLYSCSVHIYSIS